VQPKAPVEKASGKPHRKLNLVSSKQNKRDPSKIEKIALNFGL